LILLIFRHRSLNLSIRRNKTNLSRKISVITQLVISIGFAFCTCVILKQLYFLHHSEDLGFSFLNRGSVMIWDLSTNGDGVLENHLKQMPEITEVHEIDGAFDIISGYTFMLRYKSWDGKPVDVDEMEIATKPVSPEYADFYNLRLLAGEMLTDDDPTSLILINESMAKALGWHDPVGKHINGYTVKGVIKNIYNKAPTIEAKPILFIKSQKMQMVDGKTQTRSAIFKYRKGMGDTVKEKIEQFIKKEYAGLEYRIHDTEEEYNKFLKSENALIKLLSFVSAICILICVFGFVSLVSLTCEERRKSIAIRKINGATAGDILAIFAKEYFLLLIIGAAIAFPAGYIIMQRWLEQYVKQTSIPVWIYLSILLVLVLIIVLCVGWRVYKSSVENPAEVVKKE